MSKLITFKIATSDGSEEVQGAVALLQVGDKRRRFVIHNDTLSDYRSGMRVGSLNPIKLERMCRGSHATRTTDRQAAEMLMARIIARAGLAKVVATLDKPATLNA